MKNYILLLTLFLGITVSSQESNDSNLSLVINNYLNAIGANQSSLDTINSIMVVYKAQTLMGEMTTEKITTDNKIQETWYTGENVMFSLVANKDECYQIVNGTKKPLPEVLCKDFKPYIALFPEISLLNNSEVTVNEIDVDGEPCFELVIPGDNTSYSYIYSKATGLKIKTIATTKSNDKTSVSEQLFKDYQSHNNMNFPASNVHKNFMNAGIEAEFKLEEVKFNVESN
jgi:hypothetical protein